MTGHDLVQHYLFISVCFFNAYTPYTSEVHNMKNACAYKQVVTVSYGYNTYFFKVLNLQF